MVRNVTAHELKKWLVNEQKAIDILTTISLAIQKLTNYVIIVIWMSELQYYVDV